MEAWRCGAVRPGRPECHSPRTQAAEVPLVEDEEDEEVDAAEDVDDFESDPFEDDEESAEAEPDDFAEDDAGVLLDEEPRLSFR